MGAIRDSSRLLASATAQLPSQFAINAERPYGSIFCSSPPERIGIHGEYDYNGLANRVVQCFQQAIGDQAVQLKVRQRGCVVILSGAVASRNLLNYVVNLANKVEGTALVELHKVTVTEDELAA